MNRLLSHLLLAILVCIAQFAHNAHATTAPESPPPALKGHDPVAYFIGGKPEPGKAEWNATHEGQVYWFSSAANRDRFMAAPTQYAPQYGGYCAFGASKGYKAAVDPKAFSLVDGKLYLNYSLKVQEAWSKDTATLIKLADEKWPETAKTTKVYQ